MRRKRRKCKKKIHPVAYNNRKTTLGNRHTFYFTIYNNNKKKTAHRSRRSVMRCGKMRKAIVYHRVLVFVRFKLLLLLFFPFLFCIYPSIFVSIHPLLLIRLFVLPSHYFTFFSLLLDRYFPPNTISRSGI